MKALVLVSAVALTACACYFAYLLGKAAYRWLSGRGADRRRRRARWRVEPRTLESGDRQIWLVRRGDEDFLFDTVRRDDYGRLDPTAWDRALYDAEAQALEFDRLRQIDP